MKEHIKRRRKRGKKPPTQKRKMTNIREGKREQSRRDKGRWWNQGADLNRQHWEWAIFFLSYGPEGAWLANQGTYVCVQPRNQLDLMLMSARTGSRRQEIVSVQRSLCNAYPFLLGGLWLSPDETPLAGDVLPQFTLMGAARERFRPKFK